MKPAVVVRALGVGLHLGTTTVLRGLDLEVTEGQQVALTGRSGSGKSTLLLLLAGLITPTTGVISWPGLDERPAVRRGQIGMVFQAPSLMPELTAAQNVTLPLRLRGATVGPAEEAALGALQAVGAGDLAEALPGQLSGGQQQRVAVARALAGRHRLVLADEPTGALDRGHAHEVVGALIDGVAANGGTLLLATHDPELVTFFDHRIAVSGGAVTMGRAA
ncbi:MAG: ABC transporter ATP-binding protein [Propionibacteriaceae bacterium]